MAFAKSTMNCSMCDNKKPLKASRVTHKYKECGLDNVTLVGVEHFRCEECGEEYFGYGNMEKLHATIAHVLLQKKRFAHRSRGAFFEKAFGILRNNVC